MHTLALLVLAVAAMAAPALPVVGGPGDPGGMPPLHDPPPPNYPPWVSNLPKPSRLQTCRRPKYCLTVIGANCNGACCTMGVGLQQACNKGERCFNIAPGSASVDFRCCPEGEWSACTGAYA